MSTADLFRFSVGDAVRVDYPGYWLHGRQLVVGGRMVARQTGPLVVVTIPNAPAGTVDRVGLPPGCLTKVNS